MDGDEAFKEILAAHLEVVQRESFYERARLSRRMLYRMLAPGGNPTLENIVRVVKAIARVMFRGVSATDRAVDAALRAADEFFMGISQVHKTANVLAERLNGDRFDYAIAGALALNVHGVQRMTDDVDVLISRKDLKSLKKHWLGRGYIEVRPGGKSIRDEETNVRIDFHIAGDFPGDGRPKPVSFPDPKASRVQGDRFSLLSLPILIELKIASGMTAKDRPGDLQDVIRLVRARNLPRDFQQELNSYVRAKFLELWDAEQAATEDC